MILATIQTGEQTKKNPVILRVLVSNQYTRIDFGYAAPWINDKGGWIHIAPHSFIQKENDPTKYLLQFAENIPLAQDQFQFESTEDWRVFSLFFAPIEPVNCKINIIENENGNEKDFNFFGIQLDFSENLLLKSTDL